MSEPIPRPPFLPDSLEAFQEHVHNHCEMWFAYFQQTYEHLQHHITTNNALLVKIEELDMKVAERETDRHQLQMELIEERGKTKGLLDQLKEKDELYLQARLNERRAVEAVLPAIKTSAPTPADQPVEKLTTTPLGTITPLVTEPTTSARLSERLPDPDTFDGSRADLRRFTTKIHQKMKRNRDRFPDAQNRMSYVTGRLTGSAYAQILPYIVNGDCLLPDYEDVLKVLERAYGDPNRVSNAQNELYRLRQKNKDFATFFADFQRLALEGEMAEDALPTMLEQAISKELRQMLLHHDPPSRDYHQYAVFLQELENRLQRFDRTPATSEYQPRKDLSPRTPARPVFRGRNPDPHPVPAGDPMDLSHQRRTSRKEKNECYRCGSANHFVRDCPEPDTRRPAHLRTTAPAGGPLSRSPRRHSHSRYSSSPHSRRSTPGSLNGVSLD
jgi:hypothetical protein